MNELASRHCTPQQGPALDRAAAAALLAQLAGWTMNPDAKEIRKTFAFANYYETMAFVNAVAFIVHREDHHPDLSVGYNKVTAVFSTHSVSGLSVNDFICAARIDLLGAA
jgi:4a-hydroxytetrahydrobiopterin dehydratase